MTVIKHKDKIYAMRKLMVILIATFIHSRCSQSLWIWTPEIGKWINPKRALKDTPDEQFRYAFALWQEKDIKRALLEFEKIPRYFPKSRYAPEAQYYIGRCFEEQGQYYKAFLAYQKLIDKYPYNARLDEIVERQYKIGNLFFVKSKDNNIWQRFSLKSAEAKAIEIFQKVVENSPYGEYAVYAQFKIALCWKRLGNYQEAEQAFKKVITNYPTSELVDDAIVHLALLTAKYKKKSAYSQEATEEAIKRLEELTKNKEQTPEVEKVLKELKEKKAESLYRIAEFYQKQRLYKSARIYYNEIIKKYPETSWAVKSAVEIKKLDAKK